MNEGTERAGRYAPAAVAELTGISTHSLRAWERRYGAIRPERTAGGARRYSDGDVARLRLLRRAVNQGHRISDLGGLTNQEVLSRLAPPTGAAGVPIEALLDRVRNLRVESVDRELALHLATLGPSSFVIDVAAPLLRRIGEEWQRGELSVAAEHAATATIRSLLGTTLRHRAARADGPVMIFATPAGERHELGASMAAVHALGLGVRPFFLGADLPAEDLARAAHELGARAIALSVVQASGPDVAEQLRASRRAVPSHVPILVGGPGAVAPGPGVEIVHQLEELAFHVDRITYE